ncbi:hypothetical protein CN434_05175 [Bacillus thuringiensis]|nr:hypothetical protein CN434_05175 [Bacillus thuringiensis]PGO92188.1 hypothetical protein CN990_02590 [Bacillus thuringiensis]
MKFSIFAEINVDMFPFREGVMNNYIPLRVTPNSKLLEEGSKLYYEAGRIIRGTRIYIMLRIFS